MTEQHDEDGVVREQPGLRVIEVGGAHGAAARAVASRVGPDRHVLALDRLRQMLKPDGRIFIDTGYPLREVPVSSTV